MIHNALQNSFQKRAAQTISSSGLFGGLFGYGVQTKNGTNVTSKSALTLSAFYNGVNILCNDYAKLPKSVVQSVEGNTKKKTSHPVSYLISQKPNSFMTAFNFDRAMMLYAVLKGNAYAIIHRHNYTGEIKSLELVNQTKNPVTVKKTEETLVYQVQGKGEYSASQMLHVPGFSFDGICGVGVVTYAAHSLGVNLSTQEYATDYYKSRGAGLAVVETATEMKAGAKQRYASAIASSINNNNGNKAMVIDEGNKFHYISLTAQEAAFLENHKNGILEVARWLNIPSFKLKVTENQNNSNMEQQSLSHVSDSILPYKIQFNQEYNAKLFTAKERKEGFKCYFNVSSLLQADKKTQAMYYTSMVYAGLMTPAEVREKEDLPFIAGTEKLLIPVNMQTMAQLQKTLQNDAA